jgi:hypothetical protein
LTTDTTLTDFTANVTDRLTITAVISICGVILITIAGRIKSADMLGCYVVQSGGIYTLFLKSSMKIPELLPDHYEDLSGDKSCACGIVEIVSVSVNNGSCDECFTERRREVKSIAEE